MADLKLSFAIDQAKAKAAAKSVSELQKTTKDLDKQLQAITKTAGTTGTAISNGLKRFSASQVQARNEILKGTRALEEQTTVLDRYRQKIAETQRAAQAGGTTGTAGRLGSTASAIGAALSGAGAGDLGRLASAGGQISQAVNQVQQLQGAIGGTSASLSQLAVAGPLAGAAMLALSLAVKKFTEMVAAGQKDVERAVGAQKTYYELLKTGTTESIKAGLAELQVKRAVAQQTRADVQAALDAQTKQFDFLATGIFGGKVVKDAVGQFTGLNDQLKSLDTESRDLEFQISAYTRALGTNAIKANDAKKTTEELAASQQQLAEQEAAILQRASDQRIAIAKREAEQERDALTKLQRDRAEGIIRLSQQQFDTRLQYQREEAQSAKQHLANLNKVRKDAQANEFELILNRDFAGLAKLRRDTDARLAEEDDRYIEERKQRLTALRQKLQDEQTAFIRERDLRIRQYQQQVTDLRQQQIREIQANDQAAQIDLQRLRDRLVAELKLKQDASAAALSIEANFQQQRLRLMQQALAAASGSTPTTAGAGGGSGTTGGALKRLAGGGPLSIGQSALVNEGYLGQRESYRAGGRSAMLPGGMGLFTPLKSGRVESGGKGGGMSISIPLTVNGSTYAEIRRRVHADLDVKLSEAFEALTAA